MLLNPQQQTAYCISKCPRTEHECYLANTKEIQWKDEQRVIHVDETGSQWQYKTRSGVAVVTCGVFESDVTGIIFQASVMCERLMYMGCEWSFNGKSEVTMRTESEEITMQTPAFGVTAVVKGPADFTKIIEQEVADQSRLHEFILQRTPRNIEE